MKPAKKRFNQVTLRLEQDKQSNFILKYIFETIEWSWWQYGQAYVSLYLM